MPLLSPLFITTMLERRVLFRGTVNCSTRHKPHSVDICTYLQQSPIQVFSRGTSPAMAFTKCSVGEFQCSRTLDKSIIPSRDFSTIQRSEPQTSLGKGRRVRHRQRPRDNRPPLPGIFAPVREFLQSWDKIIAKRRTKKPVKTNKPAKPKHRWGLVPQPELSTVLRASD